ncbi:MAG: PAS domain S-box protein [Anaerolineales bacterium]
MADPLVKSNPTQAEYFKDIVGTIREPLLVLDADLRVLAANRSFYKFFKVKAGETIGKLVYDLGNSQWDIPGLRLLLETILPQKAAFHDYNVEHEFPSIGRRILLLNARRISRLPNKAAWILLAFEDVTERMETERKLQASEERFHRAFETAQDGMLLIKKTGGQILNSNQSAEHMLGYSKRSLRKKNLWELGILKDEGQFRQIYLDLEKMGVVDLLAKAIPTRGGGNFPADVYLMDRAAVIQCNIRDISERKQSEGAIHDLARFPTENPNPVMRIGRGGILLYANEAALVQLADWKLELGKPAPRVLNDLIREVFKTGTTNMVELTCGGRIFSIAIGPTPEGNDVNIYGVDITIRKQTEKALKDSEEMQRTIFVSTPEGITVLDLHGIIKFCNHSTADIHGYSSTDQLIGKSFLDLIAEEDHPRALEGMQQVLHQGIIRDIPFTGSRRNGEKFAGELSVGLIKNSSGQPTGFVGHTKDITKRKRAEQVLLESEQRLSSIYDTVGDVIYFLSVEPDEQYRFSSVNPAFMKVTGLPAVQVIGRKVNEVITEPSLSMVLGKYRQAIQEKGLVRWEETSDYPSGRLVGDVCIAPVFDEAGNCTHLVGSVHDITDRKQAEEKLAEERILLRTLINNLPDLIYVMDSKGRKTISNTADMKVSGGKTMEDIIGKTDLELYPPELAQGFWADNMSVIDSGIPIINREETIYDSQGNLVSILTTKVPLRDGQGKIIGLVGNARDITDRKQAEEKLKEYSEHLEEMVAERTRQLHQAQDEMVRREKLAVLGQLAGGVGHELRNPLGVISNSVYYLEMVQPDADEKIRKHHALIAQEVHNAARIVGDLLDYAREISTHPQLANVRDLVEKTLSRFPVPASIAVKINIPSALPQVYADPLHVEQILGNLVTNACQAMADPSMDTKAGSATTSGRCKLTISAKEKKETVAIAVNDTGSGIAPENFEKLFEPLFSTKVTGIGLGLVVSKKLAEANGGRIEVESEVGQGSTFTLYLPVKEGKV